MPPQIPLGNAPGLQRSNSIGPGVTPGSIPGSRPAITPRPSTPSQRDASVGGPPRREGGATPLTSAAQRPRSMSLPPTMRRDGAPGGEGGSQALVLHGQAGTPGQGGMPPKLPPPRPPSMSSLPGRPGSSMALTRQTLGGVKPIGQGGSQAHGTAATSGAAESDGDFSKKLDQLEGGTRNLRELEQLGADKNDPKKVMDALTKMLDLIADLSKKLDEQMAAAGNSFTKAAESPPQG
ncbi:hypothetical protein [Rhizobacter sp. P5_C2]